LCRPQRTSSKQRTLRTADIGWTWAGLERGPWPASSTLTRPRTKSCTERHGRIGGPNVGDEHAPPGTFTEAPLDRDIGPFSLSSLSARPRADRIAGKCPIYKVITFARRRPQREGRRARPPGEDASGHSPSGRSCRPLTLPSGHRSFRQQRPERARVPPRYCSNLLMRTKLNTDLLNPYFLVYWLRSPTMRLHVSTRMVGTSPNIQKINQRTILDYPIPKASLAVQERVVQRLNALQAEVDKLQALQAQRALDLEQLMPSFLDRTFRALHRQAQ